MFILRVVLFVLLSSISSIATFNYGFRFATHFLFHQQTFTVTYFGILFAASAGFSNIILGTYSLLKIENVHFDLKLIYFFLFSLLASIPVGFICYFGCNKVLPFEVNLITSIIVTFVNSGIYFTSLNNVIKTFFQIIKYFKLKKSKSAFKFFIGFLGISVGLIVSSIGFLAALNGMNMIFQSYQNNFFKNLCYLLAFITWIPYAALFINGNYFVVYKIYEKLNFIYELKLSVLLKISFFILSGTALAEITFELFKGFAKGIKIIDPASLLIVDTYVLVPLALISSAALNYFSIDGLIEIFYSKIKNRKKDILFRNLSRLAREKPALHKDVNFLTHK